MIEFRALRAKAYAFKLDDDNEVKKAKATTKCIMKREITFKNYADALFNDEVLINNKNDLEVIIIKFVQKKLIK